MIPNLQRRHFLRGTGALIALPTLESIGFRRFASAVVPAAPPKRMIFMGMGFLFVFFGFNTAQNFVVPLFGSVGSLCTCRPDGFSRPDLT